MTESISNPVSTPTGPHGRDSEGGATIDLRFPEAQWTYRQLQARVSHARDLLARAEADAQARATALPDPVDPVEEANGNGALLAAQDLIAREWAETSRASSARLAEADAEVRRIGETARAEARALRHEAEFLRSRDMDASGPVRSRGASAVISVDVDGSGGATPC